MEITDKQRMEYFRRSFLTIDGLWFMKREEETDFETALELDRKVWEIVPKIQARKIKELFGIEERGLEALARALSLKFEIEQNRASCEFDENGDMVFKIQKCHWIELMEKSDRMHLAGRIGRVIGAVEYQAWADEFGDGITLKQEGFMCEGDPECVMRFTMRP